MVRASRDAFLRNIVLLALLGGLAGTVTVLGLGAPLVAVLVVATTITALSSFGPRIYPSFMKAVLVLVPFQLFFSLAGRVDVSLAWVLVVALGAFLLMHPHVRSLFKQFPPARWYVLLLATLSLALLYSSDLWVGARTVAFVSTGFFALVIGYVLGKTQSNAFQRGARILLLVALPLALANIAFLIKPAWELAYLRSALAPFLVEPDSLREALTNPGYGFVLDPAKAGTVYLGPNSAALFFGFLLWLSVDQWLSMRNHRWLAVAVVFGLAVLATGSRGGLLGLAASTLAVLAVQERGRGWLSGLGSKTLLLVGGGLALLAVWSLPFFETLRLRIVDASFSGRLLLWATAIDVIRANPWLGLGYGGWESVYKAELASFLGETALPVHNALLSAWVWAGAAAAFATVGLYVSAFRAILSEVRRSARPGMVGLLGMMTWLLIQSLVETYPLADARLTSMFWIFAGLAFAPSALPVRRGQFRSQVRASGVGQPAER